MEHIVLPIFFFLQIGDYLTTVEILKRGGKELNPVMKFFMDRIGVIPALFIMKVATIVLVWQLNNFWATLGLVILYMVVVGHNLFQLRKFYRR